MYKLVKMKADSSNHGSARNKGDIKYIVIHYTANVGDTAEANGEYFKDPNRNASAHYFVDDTTVVKSVNDLTMAWAVGGVKYNDYKRTGGAKFYGIATNHNSISIETCGIRVNGVIKASDDTLDNVVILTRKLMKRYGIPASRVIRHFDVTGKYCPGYFIKSAGNIKHWEKFKSRLVDEKKATVEISPKSSEGKIKWLQGKLGIKADGVWGEVTTTAVIEAYRRYYPTKKVTGKLVGPGMIAKLKK